MNCAYSAPRWCMTFLYTDAMNRVPTVRWTIDDLGFSQLHIPFYTNKNPHRAFSHTAGGFLKSTTNCFLLIRNIYVANCYFDSIHSVRERTYYLVDHIAFSISNHWGVTFCKITFIHICG